MIRHALLGILCDGADHGYRLKRRLDALLGPVWQVNVGQVYRALDQLRRARWVEELPPDADRDGGHERWPVAITAAGAAELARWLDSPIAPAAPPAPSRSPLLARLAVGGFARVDRVLQGIETERRSFASARAGLERAKERLASARTPAEIAALLAVEAACLQIEAHLAWLDLCRVRLSEGRERG